MPELSRFYGIVVKMYYNDHNPPHFHVIYSGDQAVLSIETLELIEGSLTKRAIALVREWAELHHEELRNAWQQAQAMQPVPRIAPLP